MRCEKNMRARRMFYFHFSREERANAQLKRSARGTASTGIPFYARDIATDASDMFRNAPSFFKSDAERGQMQKDTPSELRQIRAIFVHGNKLRLQFRRDEM